MIITCVCFSPRDLVLTFNHMIRSQNTEYIGFQIKAPPEKSLLCTWPDNSILLTSSKKLY